MVWKQQTSQTKVTSVQFLGGKTRLASTCTRVRVMRSEAWYITLLMHRFGSDLLTAINVIQAGFKVTTRLTFRITQISLWRNVSHYSLNCNVRSHVSQVSIVTSNCHGSCSTREPRKIITAYETSASYNETGWAKAFNLAIPVVKAR